MKKILSILFICLCNMTFGQMQCVSLSGYNNSYLTTVSNDDITYPPGSAFITSGDIRYLKHDTNDVYQFIQHDSLVYSGDMSISVSTAFCINRTLGFNATNLQNMVVNGDSIFTFGSPPILYSGVGFDVRWNGGGNYVVSGNFDMVSLFSSSGSILSNVCLTCGSCILLGNYNDTYLSNVSNNDISYPAGSPFMTFGDIRYLKHDNNDVYLFIQHDSLVYSGDLDIDLSTSTCTTRTLNFSSSHLDSLKIDGDTVFTTGTAPPLFTGSGFYMLYDGLGNYAVTGLFDVVSLSSSLDNLFHVCFNCGIIGIEENNSHEPAIYIYPNPTTDVLHVQMGIDMEYPGKRYEIYNYTGNIVLSGLLSDKITAISTYNLREGIYFLRINNKSLKFIRN